MDREVLKSKLESFDDKDLLSIEQINESSRITLDEDINRQRNICVEETAELIQEISKAERGKLNKIGITEELADMLICIDNFDVLYKEKINTLFKESFNTNEILYNGNYYFEKVMRSHVSTTYESLSNMIILFDDLINRNKNDISHYIEYVYHCIYNINNIIDKYNIDRKDILRIISIKIQRFNEGHR